MAKRKGPTRGRRDRRLTDGEVLTIRASRDTGRVLAERYGCSPVEICYIRKFKHYKTPLSAANWDLSGDPTDQNRFMECNLMIDKRPLYSDQPGYVSDIAREALREALNDTRMMVAQALQDSNELKLKIERLAAALDEWCRWFERYHAECVDPSNQLQIPGPPGE